MRQLLLRGLLLLLCGLLLLPALAGCRSGEEPGDDTAAGTGSDAGETPGGTDTPQPTPGELVLAADGTVRYRIVYPDAGDNLYYEAALELAEVVKNQVGSAPRVQKESVAAVAEPQPTIYIGSTEALRASGLAEGMGLGDYRVAAGGEDLYLAAYSTAALAEAVDHLSRRIRNGLEGDGITLRGYAREETVSELLNGVPLPGGDLTLWSYCVGADEGSAVLVAAGAEQSDFEDYLESLAALSYTVSARSAGATGEFAACSGDGQALYVSLGGGELRVEREPLESAFLPPVGEQSFDRACDTTGYLLGVYGGGAFENGMSMVYLLADGTFLIYDGGHNESDADQLWRTLSDVAAENGLGTVRISAWMLTHCHSDHTGMFPAFLRKYGGRVRLETVFLNRPSADQGSAGGSMAADEQAVLDALSSYSTGTKVRRLHTGQVFWLADVQVEVLYTAADLRQGSLSDYNDASTVTRLTINGKTVLMTGDAAAGAWGTLVERCGAALKSDILQVPHHGAAPGGSVEAYDLIDPDVLLWPAGDQLYADLLAEMNPGPCGHLVSMVSPENIHIAGVLGRVTPIYFA